MYYDKGEVALLGHQETSKSYNQKPIIRKALFCHFAFVLKVKLPRLFIQVTSNTVVLNVFVVSNVFAVCYQYFNAIFSGVSSVLEFIKWPMCDIFEKHRCWGNGSQKAAARTQNSEFASIFPGVCSTLARNVLIFLETVRKDCSEFNRFIQTL